MHGGCSVISSMLIVTAVAVVTECRSCDLGWSPENGDTEGSRWRAQVDAGVPHATAERHPSVLHWTTLRNLLIFEKNWKISKTARDRSYRKKSHYASKKEA